MDELPVWPRSRHLSLAGPVVISQTPSDPGDIGEPRISEMDGTVYVSVPEFELWPPEGYIASDASIVFISHRALSFHAPGRGVYHLPQKHHYGHRTRCGITIWNNDQSESSVVPIRVDTASRIAKRCRKCAGGW